MPGKYTEKYRKKPVSTQINFIFSVAERLDGTHQRFRQNLPTKGSEKGSELQINHSLSFFATAETCKFLLAFQSSIHNNFQNENTRNYQEQ